MAFEHDFLLCTTDVNTDLEVRNKTILGWMQDIGALHSDSVGCGMIQIEETRLSWVIIQWKVRIFRRMRYGETIRVKTWASGKRRLYTFRQYEFRDENGELVAAASSKWVLTHLDKGMITTPDELMEKYESEDRTVFEEGNDMERLLEPAEADSEYVCEVPVTWIDVNGHMNNIYYLDLAYQALPDEVYRSSTFDSFEIMYKRECKQGDTLKCLYHFDGEHHVVTVKSEDGKKLHAIIRLKD